MYRSASLLDSQEVMALYGGHRERYCLKDDGSISEVRAAKCSRRTDANTTHIVQQVFILYKCVNSVYQLLNVVI